MHRTMMSVREMPKATAAPVAGRPGELAADWVKVGVVAHIPSVLANEKDSDS